MKTTLIAASAALLLSFPAAAANDKQSKEEMRDPTHATRDIAEQKKNLKVNRAEKADAKKRGDKLDQASQSVQIGANKAAIAGERADRQKDRTGEENPVEGTAAENDSPNAVQNKH
jgi:hypothetical protein